MRRKRNFILQSHRWFSWLYTPVPLVAFISLLAVSVTAQASDNCTNPEPRYGWLCILNSESDNTVVNVWCPWDLELAYVRVFINATRKVAERNPDTKFIITMKSWAGSETYDSYNEEIRAAAKEGTMPTLFVVSSTWIGYLSKEMVLHNLTDWVNRWNSANQGSVRVSNSIVDIWAPSFSWWSIPMTTDTMLLAYNKLAFNFMGVPYPNETVTWEEVYDLARRVNSSRTGKYGFGLYEGWEGSTKVLLPLLQSNDNSAGRLLAENKCAVNNPTNLEALSNFTSMWTHPGGPIAAPPAHCEKNVGGVMPTDLTDAFGGVAMLILPPSILSTLNRTNLGYSSLPRSFLGGAGLSIDAQASAGTRMAAFQLVQEILNLKTGNLESLGKETFSPPPVRPAQASPWNFTGDEYTTVSRALLSGIDISYPYTMDPYTFMIENRHLFRCLLSNVSRRTVTLEKGLEQLCREVNSITKELCALTTSCRRKPSQVGLILGLVVAGLGLVASIAVISTLSYLWGHWNTMSMRLERRISQRQPTNSVRGLRRFTRKELRLATNNFDKANLIGKGGFGWVYKGVLLDQSKVAIKQLTEQSYQGEEEFLNEIEIIGAIHHRNLVCLQGYCLVDKQMMLVYDYMENGSLEDAIFGRKRRKLTWPQSFEILNCTATGISYLHDACQYKIIHRDIKPANILLDSSFKARVADFGMAKNTDWENTHVSTRVMGTTGYLDPNYGYTGQLTEKSDVYSFGVVILVVLLGRRPVESETVKISGHEHEVALLDWLQYVGELAIENVKERFGDDFVEAEARRCILVAILCIQKFADARPTMSQVVQMLVGIHHIPRLPSRDPIKDVFIPDYTNASAATTLTSTPSVVDSESCNASGPMFSISNKDISLITEGR